MSHKPARDVIETMPAGALADVLVEAADLLDRGAVAPSETMRAIYRDVILEAINRMREVPKAEVHP